MTSKYVHNIYKLLYTGNPYDIIKTNSQMNHQCPQKEPSAKSLHTGQPKSMQDNQMQNRHPMHIEEINTYCTIECTVDKEMLNWKTYVHRRWGVGAHW